MTVYLVGRWLDETALWGVQGIFSQEWRAMEACRDASCFYLPFQLDEEAATLEMEKRPARSPALEDPFTVPIAEQERAV